MECGKCGEPASKKCSKCKSIAYCSVDCQKVHWKDHKPECGDCDDVLRERGRAKELKFDDFELIRDIGEGNFSRILLVEHTEFKKSYALKLVVKQKLMQLRKELDIL
jgi:serine/threonine protein kinase